MKKKENILDLIILSFSHCATLGLCVVVFKWSGTIANGVHIFIRSPWPVKWKDESVYTQDRAQYTYTVSFSVVESWYYVFFYLLGERVTSRQTPHRLHVLFCLFNYILILNDMINHSALNIIYLTETKKNILQPAAVPRSVQKLTPKNASATRPPRLPPEKKPATTTILYQSTHKTNTQRTELGNRCNKIIRRKYAIKFCKTCIKFNTKHSIA